MRLVVRFNLSSQFVGGFPRELSQMFEINRVVEWCTFIYKPVWWAKNTLINVWENTKQKMRFQRSKQIFICFLHFAEILFCKNGVLSLTHKARSSL